MVPLTERHLFAARARIAAAVASAAVSPVLGSIRLRDDQCVSVGRVMAALERDGGCLLADDVGTGKTYVALAVARAWALPLIVVPASLRSTWIDAMSRAGVRYDITSHEALSRGRIPTASYSGLVVDESHRFRSTAARRHALLAELCAHAPVLLLSATPLQNRTRDLAAQVAMFHGSRAFRLDAQSLARFVVRGTSDAGRSLPAVAPPRYLRPAADDTEILREILALPTPTAPVDGGDAGILRTIGLVRAWASSRAALADMLRRRRQVATAIEQCAAHGLMPAKGELGAWLGADATIQLGFASLLASAPAPSSISVLQADVAREQQALGRLACSLASRADPDHARAEALLGIRAAHPGASVLAFSERASTARAYHALLARHAGVGLLTARDARIASGRLSREELLSRFAPRARNAPAPSARERVTLLIATDLLSEGVNLQDASVVVHLDLPWNPARLAQRVGRVRRPGGAAIVHSYLMAPPADTEVLLEIEHRLRRKVADAATTIGGGFDVLPPIVDLLTDALSGGVVSVQGEMMTRIARWGRPERRNASPPPVVAAVEAEVSGWLAALDDGRVVADLDAPSPDATTTLATASRLCEGASRALTRMERERCMTDCRRRLDAERLARICGREDTPCELSVVVERRVAEALRRAPRHERATIAVLGRRLRDLIRAPRPLGFERAFERILASRASPHDIGWMRDAHDLASRADVRPGHESNPSVVAMIVIGPSKQGGADPRQR